MVKSPRPQVAEDSDSGSEDEFLRLASASARRKAGLPVRTSSPRGDRQTQTEKSTNALRQAARKATFIVSGQNAANRRLQATMDALEAKTKSLTVGTPAPGKTIFEAKAASGEIPLSAIAMQSAPSDVQEMYKVGYAYMESEQWKEAAAEWEKIVILPEPSLDWFLPLLAQLAFVYKKLGYLRQAIKCYERIRTAIRTADGGHLDFLADTLHQLSAIYHELGDMARAMACTDEASAILLELVGKSCDTPAEKARLEELHEGRLLGRLLQDAASGDFDSVHRALGDGSVGFDRLGAFVDPATSATFLMAAAGAGSLPLVTALAEAMPPPAIERRDAQGNSALAWACKFGQVAVVAFLLEHGASFQSLKKEELKTWPKESLATIQAHLARKKAKKEPLYQPLVPVAPTPPPLSPRSLAPTTVAALLSPRPPASMPGPTDSVLSPAFNAAPRSTAAASGALVGRELQQWQPDDDDEGASVQDGLEAAVGDWDQFEANKRLFNVSSGFDERVYTTAHVEGTAAQRAEAQRLADEILTERSTNKHVREERGLSDDEDTAYDPEARYGAVLGSGAYAEAGAGEAAHDGFTDRAVLHKPRHE
ncbi:hypothetical protein ACHHYP_00762 [Achlya hypogyna]|uniref:LsmAD domain-containing protein n=1 Tax=Achlya hypogyna TaxID=1202772 RepID=A0A1V9ZTY6_ACHHY|nr:hypothetical protein ACHHYP_00762 [Achlya hypogyna]